MSQAARFEDLARQLLAGPDREAPLTSLAAALSRLDVDHLDLDRRLRQLDRRRAWSSVPLLHRQGVSVGLFLMPRGGVIPLHDHPGMYGLMRILRGRLLITGYDLLDPRGAVRRAFRAELGSQGPAVPAIRPLRHALHEVVAVEDAAFLDLFVPPYDPAGGRPCGYYTVAAGPDGRLQLSRTSAP